MNEPSRFDSQPLWTPNLSPISLENVYQNAAAFLVCGGPSLANLDLSHLNARGVVACAVNNAATVVRPQLWVCVDQPGNFSDAIWRDAGILKFAPVGRLKLPLRIRDTTGELVEADTKASDLPSVLGYSANMRFNPAIWLSESTFNCGNSSDLIDDQGNRGSRSVMLVALRLLFYLGFRRVYLLGCDFHMSYGRDNYAFAQARTRASVRYNNLTYRILTSRLGQLLPYFQTEGYNVFNCNPTSGLKVFPFMAFDDAIREVTESMPHRVNTEGMYDKRGPDST